MRKLKKIGINTLRGVLLPVFNFCILSYGILKFGKTDWGIILNILVWTSLFTFLINWGNQNYLIKKFSFNPSKIYTDFYTNFFSRFLLVFLCFPIFFIYPYEKALFVFLIIILNVLASSFDSLYVFKQQFKQQLVVDFIGFLLLFVSFFFLTEFSVLNILIFYCFAYFLKSILSFFVLKLDKANFHFKISLNELKMSFPFFLIGLSGLLNSKIDLFFANSVLDSEKIAIYQTLTTSFILLHAVPGLATMSVSKHIMRASEKSLLKVEKILLLLAVPISLSGSFTIAVFLKFVLKIEIEWYYFLIGFLSCIPLYITSILTLKLYKNNLEKKVVIAGFISATSNLILCFLLSQYGILGFFISFSITQWIFLICIKYFLIRKINS